MKYKAILGHSIQDLVQQVNAFLNEFPRYETSGGITYDPINDQYIQVLTLETPLTLQ